jgi:tRNA pseudouridine38-40 synthase
MRNIRLIVEYDGTAYCGWQRQENGLSIQEVLERCIGRMTGERIQLNGSGRTDAGVHALGQVANFRTCSRLGEWNLLMGINSLLPPDIAVREVRDVDPDFHARFAARRKTYLYRICNRPVRSALERHYAWFVWEPLALERIEAGLSRLIGTHDFTSFCATHSDGADRIRTVLRASVVRAGEIVEISMEADGFLRYMVRTIVGTLVEVGRGKIPPERITAILAARDRRLAGMTAPPQGLFLKDVTYR